jgi:hypothetical protein
MDEGPNPGGKRRTGGTTGPFFAVRMKKTAAGASPGPWLEMLSSRGARLIPEYHGKLDDFIFKCSNFMLPYLLFFNIYTSTHVVLLVSINC